MNFSKLLSFKACEALMRLRKKWNAMLLSFLKGADQTMNSASQDVRSGRLTLFPDLPTCILLSLESCGPFETSDKGQERSRAA